MKKSMMTAIIIGMVAVVVAEKYYFDVSLVWEPLRPDLQ